MNLSGVRNKDQRQLLRKAAKQGVIISKDGKGHLRLVCPNGYIIRCASSVSDYRGVKNIRAHLRQQGIDV